MSLDWKDSGRGFLVIALALLLAGCASKDHVVFVTKTSLSIVDADTTPPGVSIAYDRTEGVVGPTFRHGHAPAVLAHISSDGQKILTPRVKQAYATGDAARLLAGGGNDPCTPKTGKKPTQEGEGVYPMFFATQTVAGLKVEFSAVGGATPVPSGFVFGYRRKEASAIRVSRVPAGDLKESDDCVPNNGFEHVIYPPVLASIDLQAAAGANAQGGAEPALINCQFFATGEAARRVARLGLPGLDCNAISQQTFAKYYDTKEQLQEQGLRTLSCYVRLKPEQRPLVWKDMTRLELWGDLADDEKDPKGKKHPEQIALRHFEGAKLGGEAGRRALAAADEVYTTSLGPAGSLAGFEEGRVRAMQAHRKLVCDLAAVK